MEEAVFLCRKEDCSRLDEMSSSVAAWFGSHELLTDASDIWRGKGGDRVFQQPIESRNNWCVE